MLIVAYAVSLILLLVFFLNGQAFGFNASLVGLASLVSMLAPVTYLFTVFRKQDWRTNYLGVFCSLFFILCFSLRGIVIWILWPEANWLPLKPKDLFLAQLYVTLGFGMWMLGYSVRTSLGGQTGWRLFQPRQLWFSGLVAIAALGLAGGGFNYMFQWGKFWEANQWIGTVPAYFGNAGIVAIVAILVYPHFPLYRRLAIGLVFGLGITVFRMAIAQRSGILLISGPLVFYLLATKPMGRLLRNPKVWVGGAIFLTIFVYLFGVWTVYKQRSLTVFDFQGGERFARAIKVFSEMRERQQLERNSGWKFWTGSLRLISRRSGYLDKVALIFRYTPQRYPHQYGRTYLFLPRGLIPRALWPHKPAVNLGRIIYRLYFGWKRGKRGGAGATLYGESYINFHLAGIVVVMFLLGIVYRTIQNFFFGREFSEARYVGNIILAQHTFSLGTMHGDSSQIFAALLINVFFTCVLFHFLGGAREPEEAAGEEEWSRAYAAETG